MTNELSPELDRRMRIHVERIVRPVRAVERRKDRMREELLAHATAAYLEERQGCSCDNEALAVVFSRLGETAEITRELQSGVTWAERILFTGRREPTRVKRWLIRKQSESIWRYTARFTLFYALIFPLAAVAASWVLVPLLGRKHGGLTRLTANGPMLLWLYLLLVVFCLLIPVSIEAVHRAIWGPVRRYGVAVGICLLYIVAVLVVFFWIRWETLDRYFVISPDLWAFAVAAMVTPVNLIVSSRLVYLERQRFHRWTSLEIAE